MNFTPNQARVPQQQVQHQVPVTTSEVGNMQKNNNMPNQAFPVNPQAPNVPQKLNEDHNKIQMPPSSGHHPVQQTGQNNNNHGLVGSPQIVNAQNINRSVNSGPLLQQSTQPMMTTNISQAGQKSNVGLFQQLSQMSQLYQSAAIVQSQQPLLHASLPSPNILQKLQATIPQVGHQMKPAPVQLAQQQMKTVLPPTPLQLPVSQQNMQYSPPKQHPQMKTTAKLASPGSQLQILQQKSPTASHPPHPLGQQATQKQQNVPSTPPPVSAAPLASSTAASPPKTQALPAQPPAKYIAVPVVPSTPVTIALSQLPAKPAPAPMASEPALTKAVEQPKETQLQAAAQSKPVPKQEEKKPAPAETNNKVEKLVTPAAGKPVVAVSTPSKNTMRLATVTPARQKKPPPTKPPVAPATPSVQKSTVKPVTSAKLIEAPKTPSVKKSPATKAAPAAGQSNSTSTVTTPKTKRSRNKVQPFQSPTPELALVTKLSTQIANSSNKNGTDDNKLTIFYKNEFLAVRNDEGTFFLCQTMQNVYKASSKIRIRWLNEKNEGEVNESGARSYTLDFYDITDFECVLTTVELDKVEGKVYELPKEELARIESILKKAIDVQKGLVPRPTVTEENPDGLDLSLYKDESQLDKSSPRKRRRGIKSEEEEEPDDDEDYEEHPKKKVIKRPAAVKTPKMMDMKIAPVMNDESTESDEENLMEIKKKAVKKQAATSKAPEPIASTSKAPPASARGRKRVAKSSEKEVPEKVAKVETVKETTPAKPVAALATKAKAVVKVKPLKKIAPEKDSPVIVASPVEKKPAQDKKLAPEKKTPAKKSQDESEAKSQAAKISPVVKVTPAKKSPAKATKTSPAPLEPQPATPSTSRSRNTRSKK